jgi:lipopolysaccharide assembly protein A
MRYLLWILKFALFVLILSFAAKNTETVSLRYYLGYEWQAPLVLVLLIFFCVGVAVGIIASLGHLFRQRRQIAALKQELRVRGQVAGKGASTKTLDTA